jgi:hypothetical protein
MALRSLARAFVAALPHGAEPLRERREIRAEIRSQLVIYAKRAELGV